MLRFHGSNFASVMSQMGMTEALLHVERIRNATPIDPQTRQLIVQALTSMRESLTGLLLSPILEAKLGRLLDRATSEDCHQFELEILVGEFREDFLTQLSASTFLMIPPEDRASYEQGKPLFGEGVDQEFPDAYRDIAAAGRCKALGESTACVFHLMRVLEKGLQKMAVTIGVQTPKPLDQEEWMKLIQAIEDKIKVLQGNTASQDLKAYSDAATNFHYFKDAWRNHVSHAREFYDTNDADIIWTHVRSFMQRLATI